MFYLSEIIFHLKKAQEIASKYGYRNLLQPGLVKELVLGQILEHEVHKTKHEADAWNPKDKSEKFEYLTCFEKGTFQFDRMFKFPLEKRQKSIERITRNSKIYCAVFEEESPLNVLKIFEISVKTVVDEVERQLDNSSNEISHVSLSVKWCEQNGKIVYPNQTNKPAET